MHIDIHLILKSALLYQVFYTTLSIILIKINFVYLKEIAFQYNEFRLAFIALHQYALEGSAGSYIVIKIDAIQLRTIEINTIIHISFTCTSIFILYQIKLRIIFIITCLLDGSWYSDNRIQILTIRSCCRISIVRIIICNCIHIFDFSKRINCRLCSICTCLAWMVYSKRSLVSSPIDILRFMYGTEIHHSALTLIIITYDRTCDFATNSQIRRQRESLIYIIRWNP